MRKILAVAALSLGLSIHAGAVQAWGQNGHRITGKIAEDNLNATAAAAVQAIAGQRSLALIATWPDFIRSFPIYDCLKPWHLRTVEDGQDFDEAMAVKPFISDRGGCNKATYDSLDMPNNVVAAIDFFAAILSGDAEKADRFAALLADTNAAPLEGSIELSALALLVHLVGDVHQPLHVGRGPDRGGNTITVDWFDSFVNFHEVWDIHLIENEGLSYSEFAAFLEQEFADKPAIEYGDGPTTWAKESVAHREAVFDFGGNSAFNVPRLSYVYAANQNALLQERLYRGGRRLAQLLNEILGQ